MTSSRPTLRALALALTTLLALNAQAASVQVLVTDADGKPAIDTVVLIEPAIKPLLKPPAAPVVIAQENLRFAPFLTVVPAGTTLRFLNRDTYDHHVRSVPSGPLGSMPAVKNFEIRLDAAESAPAAVGRKSEYDDYQAAAPRAKKTGSSQADIKVETAGPIGLGCHLHASMRGQVYVTDTPWFAKTDENGIARIDNVPEGAAQLVLWHPDQLQDQPPQPVQVSAEALKANGKLNFVPRKRRGA
jgi:plastocyanin